MLIKENVALHRYHMGYRANGLGRKTHRLGVLTRVGTVPPFRYTLSPLCQGGPILYRHSDEPVCLDNDS